MTTLLLVALAVSIAAGVRAHRRAYALGREAGVRAGMLQAASVCEARLPMVDPKAPPIWTPENAEAWACAEAIRDAVRDV